MKKERKVWVKESIEEWGDTLLFDELYPWLEEWIADEIERKYDVEVPDFTTHGKRIRGKYVETVKYIVVKGNKKYTVKVKIENIKIKGFILYPKSLEKG